jgi:hypothetical protein
MVVSDSMGSSGRARLGVGVGAGDDRDEPFLAGAPVTAVEHVVLQSETDSMAALSAAKPALPIEPTVECRVSARWTARDRIWPARRLPVGQRLPAAEVAG